VGVVLDTAIILSQLIVTCFFEHRYQKAAATQERKPEVLNKRENLFSFFFCFK
jgi:hypothetical protein